MWEAPAQTLFSAFWTINVNVSNSISMLNTYYYVHNQCIHFKSSFLHYCHMLMLTSTRCGAVPVFLCFSVSRWWLSVSPTFSWGINRFRPWIKIPVSMASVIGRNFRSCSPFKREHEDKILASRDTGNVLWKKCQGHMKTGVSQVNEECWQVWSWSWWICYPGD